MSVLVLGTFDGVHIAHAELLKQAKKTGEKIIVCTFSSPFSEKEILSTPDEKVALLKQLGANEVFLQDFSLVKELSPEEYVKMLAEKFHPKFTVCGVDHRFGKNAMGNHMTLCFLGKKYGFTPILVPPVSLNGSAVSSTLIRHYLKEGNVEEANLLLNRYYSVKGTVVEGKRIGSTIDFPTANVKTDKLLPQNGVYATLVRVKGRLLKGMTNIGTNPTVNQGDNIFVETHILGFNGDIYGSEIEIFFLKKVRDDIKFPSLEALKEQLSQDALLINAYIDTVKQA
ncbi:MAG: bifunctional riboflavin kinase/FAD synthetase [Clostridia bacterium]|nr:bifunctional riboflavin kinase/FAD synthetase [Clostridia bacterium]